MNFKVANDNPQLPPYDALLLNALLAWASLRCFNNLRPFIQA